MWCTVALRTSTRCQLKAFYLQKRNVYYSEVKCPHENLLIGQETSVRCTHKLVPVLSGLNLGKMYGLFPGTNKTVLNNEVSVLSGCPVKRGSRLYVQDKRRTVLFLMVSFKYSKDNNRVIQKEQLA